MSILSRPAVLFRRIAIAEAITWALLLTGMFLKYVTHTTELGVKVFGMIHGVVFVSYVVTTVTVWVDQKWTARRGIGALLASIPPFVTVLVEVLAVRRGWLGESWRLRESSSGLSHPERAVRWVLLAPVRGALVGVAAVVLLSGLALMVGPPKP